MRTLEMTQHADAALVVGAMIVDPGRYAASFRGRPLELSRSEHELLALLVGERHRILSRPELSARLGLERERSVDVVLTHLRQAVGVDFVRNVRGRGWILVPESLHP